MRLLQKWALRSNRGKVLHALFLCCQAILWGILDAMRRRPSSVTAGRDSRGSVGEQLTSKGVTLTGLLVVRFMLGDVDCERVVAPAPLCILLMGRSGGVEGGLALRSGAF